MQEYGVAEKNIYIDKQSGKDFNSRQYKRVFKRLKENDLLILKALTERIGKMSERAIGSAFPRGKSSDWIKTIMKS